MTLQIDWAGTSSTPGGVAYEIYVPKTDLTLIQSNPTEIRELDVDTFRYWLLDLQDNPDGRPWPRTHNHNTELTLGGLTFARQFEIIDPYSVTFEDGQYAVNIVGGNSNILDKTNRNQVSLAPNNSAGLITTPLIQDAAFEGGVTIDETNVTGRAVSGTLFPTGTFRRPVDNVTDAKLIDDNPSRGYGRLYVIGPLTLDGAYDLSRFTFEGRSYTNSTLDIKSAPNVTNAVLVNLGVTGVLDGGNELRNCHLEDLMYVNGYVTDCGISGSIALDGGANAVFADCYTVDPYNPAVIDLGGSGQNLAMPRYSGLLHLQNLSGANFVGVGLAQGQVVLRNTITAGTVHVSGVGTLEDELGNHIPSGTWNGGVTVINELSGATVTSEAVWDKAEKDFAEGTMGYALQIVRMMRVNGLNLQPGDTNNWTLYDDNGVEKLKFNVTGPSGEVIEIREGTPAIRSKGVIP